MSGEDIVLHDKRDRVGIRNVNENRFRTWCIEKGHNFTGGRTVSAGTRRLRTEDNSGEESRPEKPFPTGENPAKNFYIKIASENKSKPKANEEEQCVRLSAAELRIRESPGKWPWPPPPLSPHSGPPPPRPHFGTKYLIKTAKLAAAIKGPDHSLFVADWEGGGGGKKKRPLERHKLNYVSWKRPGNYTKTNKYPGKWKSTDRFGRIFKILKIPVFRLRSAITYLKPWKTLLGITRGISKLENHLSFYVGKNRIWIRRTGSLGNAASGIRMFPVRRSPSSARLISQLELQSEKLFQFGEDTLRGRRVHLQSARHSRVPLCL